MHGYCTALLRGTRTTLSHTLSAVSYQPAAVTSVLLQTTQQPHSGTQCQTVWETTTLSKCKDLNSRQSSSDQQAQH